MGYRKDGVNLQGGSVELPALLCHVFITHVVTWPPLPLSPGVILDCLCVFTATDLFSTLEPAHAAQLNQAAGGHFFPFSI